MRLRSALATFALGIAAGAWARVEPPHEEPPTKSPVVLPATKTVDGRVLLLNGTGTHRRLIFDVYALSLYVTKPSSDPRELLESPEPKLAEMKFLRNVAAADIRDGFRVSFDQNCAAECADLKGDFDALMRAMPAAKNGTVFLFYLWPDRTVVRVAGQPDVSFANARMGRVLLRTWIGENPPSERFKREVLRGGSI